MARVPNNACLLQLMEIKRLNASMATIRSQLNKYEEQVEECRRYQKFLDSVTPVEWQEQQKQALAARQNQRHAAWLLHCEALKKQKQDAKGEVSTVRSYAQQALPGSTLLCLLSS